MPGVCYRSSGTPPSNESRCLPSASTAPYVEGNSVAGAHESEAQQRCPAKTTA